MSTLLLRCHISNIFSSSLFLSCCLPSFVSLTVWRCPPYHTSLDLYSFIMLYQRKKNQHPHITGKIQKFKYMNFSGAWSQLPFINEMDWKISKSSTFYTFKYNDCALYMKGRYTLNTYPLQSILYVTCSPLMMKRRKLVPALKEIMKIKCYLELLNILWKIPV